MRRALTPRERRIGAWLLLAVLLATFYSLIIGPLIVAPLQALNLEMHTLGDQRQHYQQRLGQRQGLEQALQTAHSSDEGLLQGDDPSAVAADLMQNVAQRITDISTLGGGCQLTQRMPIVEQPQGQVPTPFRQVRLSLDLECAIEPLTTVLQGLEAAQPLLFVDELSIHRGNNAPATGGAGRLSVHLLVSGFLAAAPALEKGAAP